MWEDAGFESRTSVVEPEPLGAGVNVRLRLHLTEDKTEEILNYMLFVCSLIDYRQFKKQIQINDLFLVRKVGCYGNHLATTTLVRYR